MTSTARHANIILFHQPEPYPNKTNNDHQLTVFEQLVEQAPDLVYTVNSEGKFSFVNARSMGITEYSREELLTMHYLDLIAPEYVNAVKKFYVRQAVRGPELTYFEFPMVTKSGRRVWIGQNVVMHGSSPSMAFQAIARDISDKKKADEQLLQLKEHYKNIFDHAVQGMFQSTVDGKIISANPALLKMLGYSSIEELHEINLSDLYVDKEDRELLSLLLSTKGRCSNVELKLKRKDGKIITVVEHSRAVTDLDNIVTMYEGIIEDVSVEKAVDKEIEQYVEALKASDHALRDLHVQKNKMISIIAHDLRSPFSSILGFCDVLLQDFKKLSEDECYEYLGYIKDSARAQLSFVNDLLDFSKLDSGQTMLTMKAIDLQFTIYNAITALLGAAKQKEITLTMTLTENVIVRGDEKWLLQAFTNIIGNALKFTKPHGSITVSLRETTNEAFVIDIADTGIGIPEHAIPKLFKIEEKYTTFGTNGERGNGLGLPVCHEIITKHGGAISVESVVGKGTVFHLTFPRINTTRQKKVMIVDDEAAIRKLHSRYIEEACPAFAITHAGDGKEALKKLEEVRPDIIITDYSMPGMNGFDLIQALKQNPRTSEIPVIIVTANSSDANRESLLLSGARAVVSKPVAQQEFQSVVKKILEEEG